MTTEPVQVADLSPTRREWLALLIIGLIWLAVTFTPLARVSRCEIVVVEQSEIDVY